MLILLRYLIANSAFCHKYTIGAHRFRRFQRHSRVAIIWRDWYGDRATKRSLPPAAITTESCCGKGNIKQEERSY
jgi:hypothetical protein